jgi:hypothetical protein
MLMSAALCALWARSVGHVASTEWVGPKFTLQVQEIDGVLGLLAARDGPLQTPSGGNASRYNWWRWRHELPPGRDRASLMTPSFNAWGFGFHTIPTVGPPQGNWRIGGRRLVIVYVPYWLPALAAAVPPVALLASRLRGHRRLRAGRCGNCGYDLRATPDRCPECGNVSTGATA